MKEKLKKRVKKIKRERSRAAVTIDLGGGKMAEAILTDGGRQSAFCVWDGSNWKLEQELIVGSQRYRPYAARNPLLEHRVVLLSGEPCEYESESKLLERIRAFIHRYVDLEPSYETVASYYVLLTWLYDRFSDLPYLRLRGEPGTGKTRFLLTVGSICYKPILASGASTISPLFRILDAFRGTLIVDEGNWRLTDEKSEITKIFCNGNGRGFPVLRAEPTGPSQEYAPRAYHVFGPKIIATRGPFKDLALESRCLTEDMGQRPVRKDVPISLPTSFHEEATEIRSQLLLWRFRNLKRKLNDAEFGVELEPRLRQVFAPLLAVIQNDADRLLVLKLAQSMSQELEQERASRPEAQVFEIIKEMREKGETLTVKEITSWFDDRHGDEYDRKVTARWVGWLIRQRLRMRTERVGGQYIVRNIDERVCQRPGYGYQSSSGKGNHLRWVVTEGWDRASGTT